MKFLSLFVVVFIVAGCSSNKTQVAAPKKQISKQEKVVNPPLRGIETNVSVGEEPDSVAAIKSPTEITERGETIGNLSKPYFANLQILTETVVDSGSCTPEMSLSEESLGAYAGMLTKDRKIQTDGRALNSSLFNIQLRSMGFDSVRYRFSMVDSKLTAEIPYKLSINVRPNNAVEVQFFDKVTSLKLDTSPVFTFSVKEERGGDCVLTHNINIFAENAGRFDLASK